MADRQPVDGDAKNGLILLTGATGYVGGRLLRPSRRHRPPGAVSGEAPVAPRSAPAVHRGRPGRLPRRGVARPRPGGCGLRLLPRALDGGRVRLRGGRPPRRRELRTRRHARRRPAHHLPRRIDGRDGFAVGASEEPRRNRTGPARQRRPGDRVPRLDHHRGGQPVVRDDPGAGRAAAGDDLPALGRHAHAADRHRRRGRLPARRRSTCLRVRAACSRSAARTRCRTAT